MKGLGISLQVGPRDNGAMQDVKALYTLVSPVWALFPSFLITCWFGGNVQTFHVSWEQQG